MAKKCSWCNGPIGDQFWYRNIDVNGKVKKSVQKFCSPKCEFEFAYEVTPEKSGCFVATAVYNDYNHPVVLDLRFFRDNYLDKLNWGKEFINFYYKYSPGIANIIEKNKILRFLALISLIKPLHRIIKFFHFNR
jgi:hypothetical protein